MKKIILALLAIAVCAEATFDVGLLLNLLRPPAPKYHQHPPPPPPQPPQPPVNFYLVPVVPVQQQARHYYVQRVVPVPAHDASYYRHPVSTPVDVPHFPPLSQSTATASADSVTVEAQPQPLSFTQVGTRLAEPATNQFQQSLPYAESGPAFSVETAKSEGHSFTLHPEENQTSDTVEVHAEEGYN